MTRRGLFFLSPVTHAADARVATTARRRGFCSRCWTAGRPRPLSTSPPRIAPAQQATTPARRFKPWPALLASGVLLAGGGGGYYLLAPGPRRKTLNDHSFVPYTITAREPISRTSVVLTVAPCAPDPAPAYLLRRAGGAPRWRHALWSVEFKQPEVQIARHYTPLPPAEGDDGGAGLLRFYVRAVRGGEMSAYLSRLAVGRRVWLRGPHPGFDVLRRLRPGGRVVFLAGGTGLVPALQVARAVLDAGDASSMTLLWAVREREEVQAVEQPASWRSWWSPKTPARLPADLADPSAIARHLTQIKAAYGDRLDVRVAVDREGSAIREVDVERALLAGPVAAPPAPPSQGCPCHDQRLHVDASEFDAAAASSAPCRCPSLAGARPAGKDLLIVSGPDGFVSHYAGPKAWLRGTLTQGPVDGVLGRLQARHARLADDWLVLKL